MVSDEDENPLAPSQREFMAVFFGSIAIGYATTQFFGLPGFYTLFIALGCIVLYSFITADPDDLPEEYK